MIKTLKSKSFLISLAVGAVIMAGVCVMQISRGKEIIHTLCDGTFIAGILLLCVAGLRYVSKEGQFDIFGYGISHLFATRWPGLSTMPDDHRKETYADYKLRRDKKRKPVLGILLAGAVYVVLAVIMMIIYSCT